MGAGGPRKTHQTTPRNPEEVCQAGMEIASPAIAIPAAHQQAEGKIHRGLMDLISITEDQVVLGIFLKQYLVVEIKLEVKQDLADQ